MKYLLGSSGRAVLDQPLIPGVSKRQMLFESGWGIVVAIWLPYRANEDSSVPDGILD